MLEITNTEHIQREILTKLVESGDNVPYFIEGDNYEAYAITRMTASQWESKIEPIISHKILTQSLSNSSFSGAMAILEDLFLIPLYVETPWHI